MHRSLPRPPIVLLALAAACTSTWDGLGDGVVPPPTTTSAPATTPTSTGGDSPPAETADTASTPPGQHTGDTAGDTAHTGDTAHPHTGDTGPPAPVWLPVSRGTPLGDLSGYPPLVDGGVLNSGFGPRRLSRDDGRTDVHLGIDLEAPMGTPVLAIADGRVHDLDFDGSHTLFIEHWLADPIPFHGHEVDRFYVMYSHLDRIAVAIGDAVVAGQRVASVGDSGDVLTPHLHAEVRLGSWCSLRYAVENPDSDCGRGFDPAVNPVRLVGGSVPGGLDAQIVAEEPLTVRVRTPDDDLDWNRLETDLGVLDFDLREGLDATTEEALDDLDYGWVTVEPDPSDLEPGHRSWTLTFAERPAFVEVLDWRGDGVRTDLP